MGRSYWFECPKCSYRAKVSGRADRGLTLCVETVFCRDCKELRDVVTRLRVPETPPENPDARKLKNPGATLDGRSWALNRPPGFFEALGRLALGLTRSRWLDFKPQCPVSPIHRVETWRDPGKCPRCGIFLEKNAIPFRIWD